ncbi:MAG: DUF368 domain-containing protein [Clostridia bacterium]
MEEKKSENAAVPADVTSKRKDRFIIRVIKGLIIGVACIIPGASGGVLALAMGIYRPVVDAIYGFFHAKRRNFMFLLPLGIGWLLGLFSTSRLVEWLIINYRTPVMYVLIGMVLGGVPSFIREANHGGFKPKYLLGTLVGVLVVCGFAALDRLLVADVGWPLNGWTALLAGGVLAVGTVIPGISTSFILMFMGLYEPLLSAFNRLDIPILACIAVGASAIGVLLIFLVKRMFDRHHGYSYYAVLGFLLSTVALIFPGIDFSAMQLVYIALLAAGFAGCYFLCKLPDK